MASYPESEYNRGHDEAGEKAREAMAQLGMEVHKLAIEALERVDAIREWGADLAISNEDGSPSFTQPGDIQRFDARMGAAELMLKVLNDPDMTFRDCVAVLLRAGKGR